MGYTTKEKVKNFAHISYEDLGYAAESEYDAFVNDLIERAEAVIENFCDVPEDFFADGGCTITDEYHDLRESDDYIALDYAPVLSVSSVSVNVAGYGAAKSWSAVSANDQYLYPKQGLLYLYNLSYSVEEQNVKVTYVAGYTTTPTDIQFVTEQLCANVLHDSLQRKVSPVVRVNDWAVRIIHPDVFTRELKAMLQRYRQRHVSIG
jgi:hypothetical protein